MLTVFKNYQLSDINMHWFELAVFLLKHRDCGRFYVSAPSGTLCLACSSLGEPIPTLLTSELASQLPLATGDYSGHYAFPEASCVPCGDKKWWSQMWGPSYRGTSRRVIFEKPGACYRTFGHVRGRASRQEEDTAFLSDSHALALDLSSPTQNTSQRWSGTAHSWSLRHRTRG